MTRMGETAREKMRKLCMNKSEKIFKIVNCFLSFRLVSRSIECFASRETLTASRYREKSKQKRGTLWKIRMESHEGNFLSLRKHLLRFSSLSRFVTFPES